MEDKFIRQANSSEDPSEIANSRAYYPYFKIVTQGDIKPAPVLWHEESGRKPWQSTSENPPGAISGPQLGVAAYRLVVNSLQVRQGHAPYGDPLPVQPPYYPSPPYGQPPAHLNSRHHHVQEYHGMIPPRSDYPAEVQHPGHAYNDQQYFIPPPHVIYGRSHSQYQTDNHSAYSNGDHLRQGNNMQGSSYTGRPSYPPRHLVPRPVPVGTHGRLQGGYSGYHSYQSREAPYIPHHQRGGADWTLQNHTMPRNFGHHQVNNNAFSVLDRGSSRRHPPAGYSRH